VQRQPVQSPMSSRISFKAEIWSPIQDERNGSLELRGMVSATGCKAAHALLDRSPVANQDTISLVIFHSDGKRFFGFRVERFGQWRTVYSKTARSGWR